MPGLRPRGWWAQPQGSEIRPTEPDHGSPEAPGLLQGPAGERTCPLVLAPDWTEGRLSGSEAGRGRCPLWPRGGGGGVSDGVWGRCGSLPCQPVLGQYQAAGGTVLHWMGHPDGQARGSRDPQGLSVRTACPQTPPRAAPTRRPRQTALEVVPQRLLLATPAPRPQAQGLIHRRGPTVHRPHGSSGHRVWAGASARPPQ